MKFVSFYEEEKFFPQSSISRRDRWSLRNGQHRYLASTFPSGLLQAIVKSNALNQKISVGRWLDSNADHQR